MMDWGVRQIPVAGAEPVLEQLDQVDLAAGLGEHVEVLVVDVNIPVDVGLGDVLGQDVVVHIVLGPSEPYLSMVPMAVSPSMLAFSRLMSASLESA